MDLVSSFDRMSGGVYSMKNWLGQDIEVGSFVYRGSRDGNTSSYKVGVVVDLNEEKQKIKVDWAIEPNWRNWQNRPDWKPWRRIESNPAWSDINTAVLIDPATFGIDRAIAVGV
jgi:hypothetical protein